MTFLHKPAVRRAYYRIKPLIPRQLQVHVRRFGADAKRRQYSDIWPIDQNAGTAPDRWSGWPGGKRFAFVLTHDVEAIRGHDRCPEVLNLEKTLGFRSSFNFVGDQYPVSQALRQHLAEEGFEVGVHGLVHDHQLYDSKENFLRHAQQINKILKEWGAVGFRSPCMYHNLDWLRHLDIDYDASTFDTDPFEPQPDGVGTIFPFYVYGNGVGQGYVELPYTLPQDFTLFILFRERSIDTWKRKLDWVAARGGMVLVNVHPDYIWFDGERIRCDEYPAAYYQELLEYVASNYGGDYWHALPKEVASFWVDNLAENQQPVQVGMR